MSSSNFPTYGSNTFGIDSFNHFTLQAFNPYGLYHYTVSIVSPNFPLAPLDEIKVPEVTFKDFMLWCGSFFDIDDAEHALHDLAVALIGIAKQYIDVELIGDDNDYAMYKRLVSLYVGHELELHLELLKDENNRTSFTPEKAGKTKEDTEEKVIRLVPNGSKEYFYKTKFGQMFFGIYGPLIKWAFQKKYRTWGSI